MSTVINEGPNTVSLHQTSRGFIEIGVGPYGQRGSYRYALLTPKEARQLAIALLQKAEEAEERELTSKKEMTTHTNQ